MEVILMVLADILHEVISIDRFWLNNHIKYSLTHERKWIELTGGVEISERVRKEVVLHGR